MLRKLRHVIARSRGLIRKLESLSKIEGLLVSERMDALKRAPQRQNPKQLARYGYKIYSQNEEDGIIQEIFKRIGVTNKVFVEFGVGTGLENNTVALLLSGWKGLWIDADEPAIEKIKANLKNTIAAGTLKVLKSFITKDNINELISSAIGQGEIDLLSIDIDGNDAHVFNAITCVKPRVVVMEYNAKFPPPVLFCVKYDENHVWKRDDYLGASLKFLEIELHKKGYRLVGCTLNGTNGFFVRSDLVQDKFFEPFSAENHYEPTRFFLNFSSGHISTYKTVEKAVALYCRSQ